MTVAMLAAVIAFSTYSLRLTGSKIDVMNKNGDSPLHLAVRMHHTNIVQLLVAFGEFQPL